MRPLRAIIACLLLAASLLCLVACPGDGGFDYKTADMTQYVSFGDKDYRDATFSVKNAISDADVKSDFDAFFSSSSQPYYLPIADATRAIAKGDYVYFLYSGILVEDLEKAIAEDKIADVDCTGLTYAQISALGLGFERGTTESLYPLKIGSGAFIDGFEDGLVGFVPAERGEENPVRLHLTFPTNYGNDLAGKEVVFFCKLYHIGDTAAGYYTSENISTEMLNTILGTSGEKAYASVEACLQEIRGYLEENLNASLAATKANALYSAIAQMATYQNVPESLVTEYVDEWFAARFAYLQENEPELYAYYFDPENPSRETLAYLYGYGSDYMTLLTQEANVAIRQEMVFRYIVQVEGYTVTDEIYEKWDATYTVQYGADYKDGVAEEELRDQMLRDEVTEILLAIAEERGNITYTE